MRGRSGPSLSVVAMIAAFVASRGLPSQCMLMHQRRQLTSPPPDLHASPPVLGTFSIEGHGPVANAHPWPAGPTRLALATRIGTGIGRAGRDDLRSLPLAHHASPQTCRLRRSSTVPGPKRRSVAPCAARLLEITLLRRAHNRLRATRHACRPSPLCDEPILSLQFSECSLYLPF